ncbi:LysR family transcriptional regulator [Anabaena sp. UHCC 0187]|uniref:LysR family transcriptional regulator n=1 Tax=Anabaena sp. UHCC 0187 TaxID=2590018 RepID=UPI001446D354|nr:LysR family transcriptional regulator [Anabaena sp. UHCC 0187]
MELRHLKYFVVVAENLNFSRAATQLYISQPALSRQIKNLEDELSVILFVRQSDGLKLTEAGKFFLEQAIALHILVFPRPSTYLIFSK